MYKNKYLKYKQKYLELKGGALVVDNLTRPAQSLLLNYTYIYNNDILRLIEIIFKLNDDTSIDATTPTEEYNSHVNFYLNNISDYKEIIYVFQYNDDTIETLYLNSKSNSNEINNINEFNFDTRDNFYKQSMDIFDKLEYKDKIEIINKKIKNSVNPITYGKSEQSIETIETFSQQIIMNTFSSLYRYNDNILCFAKNKLDILNYIYFFNAVCTIKYSENIQNGENIFPKMETPFKLYRYECINNIKIFINEEKTKEKIYYVPFSTTYNYDLKWCNSDILYILTIPVKCNYLFLYDTSRHKKQYEITLQQGTLNIQNTYYTIFQDKRIIIRECSFIPLSEDVITSMVANIQACK